MIERFDSPDEWYTSDLGMRTDTPENGATVILSAWVHSLRVVMELRFERGLHDLEPLYHGQLPGCWRDPGNV